MAAFAPKKLTNQSIASLENLCAALDITAVELGEARALADEEKYSEIKVPKSDGTDRYVYNPHPLIRKIQRRINNRIFAKAKVIRWPDQLYGSIPNQPNEDSKGPAWINKDYVACAARHCGAKSILKLDIKDFFDNIHQDMVVDIFSKFLNYSTEVSEALADICCYRSHVVQGGLTSSYLACLCLHDVEEALVKKLLRKNLVYTRLVDDITISSKLPSYDFSYAKNLVTEALAEKGLPLNSTKTKIHRVSSEPLMVHGLRVSFKEPRLPADEVRRIRAAVKNIEILAQESCYRISPAYRFDFNRCMGRVNKLRRVGHIQHAALVKRLKKVLPLPSKRDIERAEKMVSRLEKDYKKKEGTYWYMKRFYATHERLNILQRRFKMVSEGLRLRLKVISPSYD